MPTLFLGHHEIAQLIADYGYLIVAVMVGIEGMGIPLPGEATLIAASSALFVVSIRTWYLGLSVIVTAVSAM